MKQKMILKIGMDFIMTVLLLSLMAFNIVGQKLHELVGTIMFIVFIIHNILNYRWYKKILKGRYSTYRILQTVINISLFISMICLMISGMVMSSYVFKFLSIKGNISLARSVHMSLSYLGYVLMSVHLGMHWNMIINMFKKITNSTKSIRVFIKFIGILIACYGAYAFMQHEILLNMLQINKFAYFGLSTSPLLFFIDYLAIMGFWIFISHYFVKLLKIKSKSK